MREFKGLSLLEFPKNFTVIDIETTGLSPEWDSIIEVAALKIREGEIVDSFSSLTNSPCLVIDDFITDLTGITQEMIDAAPDISDILPQYFEFIGNDILIGHNVNFDINFLYDNSLHYCQKPLTNNFIDTMRISRRLHPEERHHRLSDLVERYSLDCTSAHRAKQDCHITFAAYNSLFQDILSKCDDISTFFESKKRERKASEIRPENFDFDVFHPLYGKTCVFTGTLEKMVRKDAMQLVANIGGINGDSVTKKTNFLILGNNDYCKTIKGGKSSKQKKAEKLLAEGQDIQIIPENVFYDMILDE